MGASDEVRAQLDDREHKRCRMAEFRRWNRVVLVHERESLSRYMGERRAFMSERELADTMHEITDIDWCLSQLGLRGE